MVELAPDGLTPLEQLKAISERLRPLNLRLGRALVDDILPKMERAGIVIHRFDDLPDSQKEYLRDYFMLEALPVITPLGIDPGHPFPHLLNRSLNLAFIVQDPRKHVDERQFHFAVVQLPTVLGRFIKIFPERAGDHFVLLEQVIAAYASALFPGLDVKASYTFRVIRDADIEVTEDEAEDLMTMMEEQVRRRKWGEAVRLDVQVDMPLHIRDILMNSLELEPMDVYEAIGPSALIDFMTLYRLDYRDLKDRPFTGYVMESLAGSQPQPSG